MRAGKLADWGMELDRVLVDRSLRGKKQGEGRVFRGRSSYSGFNWNVMKTMFTTLHSYDRCHTLLSLGREILLQHHMQEVHQLLKLQHNAATIKQKIKGGATLDRCRLQVEPQMLT